MSVNILGQARVTRGRERHARRWKFSEGLLIVVFSPTKTNTKQATSMRRSTQLLIIGMSVGGKVWSGSRDAHLFVEHQRFAIVGAAASNGARTARL